MNIVVHTSESRGHAHHGWLESKHTFSFARYYNPERMNFGLLRVLNDDIVVGGAGFGEHGHENMEIISIPISGTLAHADSLGTRKTIKQGEVQIMSAGSGLTHSEFNDSHIDPVNFLQIWIFPKERDCTPRYDQRFFEPEEKHQTLRTVVSPLEEDDALWINQDARIAIGDFTETTNYTYTIQFPNNGIYVFVINGSVQIADTVLHERDGMGISGSNTVLMKIQSNTTLLVLEIPMN